MKIRLGFVSNSSSSSFIVLSDNKTDNKKYTLKDLKYEVYNGETEFGWDWIEYKDIGSKLNFVFLNERYYNISENNLFKQHNYLINVLKRTQGKYHKLNDNEIYLLIEYMDKHINGYIDHQSTMNSDDDIREIITDSKKLEKFLFFDSYLQTGNDNEDEPNYIYVFRESIFND